MVETRYQIGGVHFPLLQEKDGGGRSFTLGVQALGGGGVTYTQNISSGKVEILERVPGKPDSVLRVNLDNVFGMSKTILVHEDWIRLGDRLYRRARGGT